MITFIIPVYNVEKYLRRCIDSVIKQVDETDEIILIDDGSNDNSGSICDEYANKFDKISVVHQKNAGLSEARNAGLKRAKCKYIIFLDSDDYIEDGSIQHIKKVIKQFKCDIYTAKAHWFKDDNIFHDKVTYKIEEGVYSIQAYMNALFYTRNYLPCAPFYIYDTSFLRENELFFYPGLLHEDELWMPEVLLHAKNVYVINKYFYCNYRREGSITQNKSNLQRGARDMCFIAKRINMELIGYPKRQSRVIRDRMVTKLLETFSESKDLQLFGEEIKRSFLIQNAFSRKNRLKSLLYCLSPKLYLVIHKRVKGF